MKFKAFDKRSKAAVKPIYLSQEEDEIVTVVFEDSNGKSHDCTKAQVDLRPCIGILDSSRVELAVGDEVGVRDVCIGGEEYGEIFGVVSFKDGKYSVVTEAGKAYDLDQWLFDGCLMVELYVL